MVGLERKTVMMKVKVTSAQAKRVKIIVSLLHVRHWTGMRLIVPQRGRPRVRATAPAGTKDICIEVLLTRRFDAVATSVHNAERYGPASGHIWCFWNEKPYPTALQAKHFLRERLG